MNKGTTANKTKEEGRMSVTTLLRLCDLVAPLVLILWTCMKTKLLFNYVHFRNSKHVFSIIFHLKELQLQA